ncbi:MAG: SDR family NAD(P)-dependent oxidoreductase [Acidimicrobiales bacterium]
MPQQLAFTLRYRPGKRSAVDIQDAVAVVTGASGGLGQAIARTLHDRGARLVLTGRREALLASLASELGDARIVVCDLADRDQASGLVGQLGDVDIFVANAALPATGRLGEFTPTELDRALDVNLRGPMLMTQQLLPSMLARGRGHFVYVASIGGKLPSARLSIYSATKYGLRGFAGCLRQDLAGSGVGASVVFPGPIIDAGMLADAGLPAAPGTKGLKAADVGRAVAAAIETNRAEIDVAVRSIRIAAKIGAIAPGLMARLASRTETRDYSDRLSEGLRHLR